MICIDIKYTVEYIIFISDTSLSLTHLTNIRSKTLSWRVSVSKNVKPNGKL